jgi:hypothetical protein
MECSVNEWNVYSKSHSLYWTVHNVLTCAVDEHAHFPRVAAKNRAVICFVVNVAVPTAIQKSRNIRNSSNNFCINASIYVYKD